MEAETGRPQIIEAETRLPGHQPGDNKGRPQKLEQGWSRLSLELVEGASLAMPEFISSLWDMRY